MIASRVRQIVGKDVPIAASMAAAQDFWDNAGVFEFVGPTDTAEGSVAQALSAKVSPFFISDTGDNPGAGGTDDSTVFCVRFLTPMRSGQHEARRLRIAQRSCCGRGVRAGRRGRFRSLGSGRYDWRCVR